MNSLGLFRLVCVTTQLSVCVISMGCGTAPNPSRRGQGSGSEVATTINPAGPIVLKTAAAEFEILPSGYIRAYLLNGASRLSLDEPDGGSDFLISAGEEISNFQLDFTRAKVMDAHGKVGTHGKRVEVTGRASAAAGAVIEKTLAVEVYDDFPKLAVTSLAYRNAGDRAFAVDRVVAAS